MTVEKQKGESVSSAWAELEEGVDADKMWPCEAVEAEAESYPYPYQLDGQEWELKQGEEVGATFDDGLNVKYKIDNEFRVNIKKHEVEFDPNKVQLFRVSLTPNEQRLQQYML